MPSTSPITTHILDTALGRPDAGVAVQRARRSADNRSEVMATGITDADGRITNLLPPGSLAAGVYCLTFATGVYFHRQGIATFYPTVAIEFQIVSAAEHYHVPILVSPFGYTTYRGS